MAATGDAMAGNRVFLADEPPDLGVYVSVLVWEGREPLLGIRRDAEGEWIFWGETEPLDEEGDEVDEDFLLYLHLHHVYERFPEALKVGLPVDRSAVRASVTDPFVEGG